VQREAKERAGKKQGTNEKDGKGRETVEGKGIGHSYSLHLTGRLATRPTAPSARGGSRDGARNVMATLIWITSIE